ncbi:MULTISPECIES: hypothetical protein [Corallococcus]|nr:MULTISPECIES: hypothetical protein [Corallococcus]
MVDSLAVEGGFLVAASDVQGRIQIFRLDTALARVATTNVEVETGLIPATVTQLVRTSRGPALFYVTEGATAASTQGHLVQLDEQGVPVVRPEGGREDAILFEQPAVCADPSGRVRGRFPGVDGLDVGPSRRRYGS